jgi:predicted amidophosphoribosyltransferase
VHLLKYGHEGAIGFSVGIALAFLLAETRADVLVPIPLHMGSPRLFNQSKKIVKGLSCKLGIPLHDCLSWNVRVSPRAPKAAKDRDSLPENAFKMKYFPRGVKTAIICDDVCTTGATIFKAATALREGGIQVVASLSFTLGQRGAYN